jgi:hypothetical protein
MLLRHGLVAKPVSGVSAEMQRFVSDGRKILLHVGCGGADRTSAGPGFQSDVWREVRLDIDPLARPDILGTILDMSGVPDFAVDAVFSSHTLEHLYAHETPQALQEMQRVLKPNGIVLATVPDLQAAAQMIAEDRLFAPAYESPSGTITPFDIVFSYRAFVGRDRPYMAHHSGFTLSTLVSAFKEEGYQSVIGVRPPGAFSLWVVASVTYRTEAELRQLAVEFIPGGPVD